MTEPVLVLTHDNCLSHVTPPGHPEQVARLTAVERGLTGLNVDRQEAPMGAIEDVLRCHPQRYIDRIRDAVPSTGWAPLDLSLIHI